MFLNKENVKSVQYKGINKLDDSSINYLIRLECNPSVKPQIRRNSIEIPYTQIDIHNK